MKGGGITPVEALATLVEKFNSEGANSYFRKGKRDKSDKTSNEILNYL
jgi:hypothetical protein